MPYVNVQITAGASREQKAALVHAFTDVILPPLHGHPDKRFNIANRGGRNGNEEDGWIEGEA